MASKVIAFIPVRGGSKSIPLKNIKLLAGKPLLYWVLEAADQCDKIDQIVVATDHFEIEKAVHDFGSSKVQVYRREKKNAEDTSSTESVMLEYLTQAHFKTQDQFILIQATNPFLTANDLTQGLSHLKKSKSSSLLSVVRTKRFFWMKTGKPLNYDFKKRPRRQDFEGLLMENGAFYISSVGAILKSKNRLSGKIGLYEMPEHSGFEIDEPDDWIICEELLNRHRSESKRKVFSEIKLFLTDVDGVLTDAGMYYTDQGDAMKKFNTLDGMGLQMLQKTGIKVGFVTGENTSIVAKRAEKLKIDILKQGIKNKLPVVQELAKEMGISLKQVAYVGDDVNCLEVLQSVGFAACPPNAVPEVKRVPGIIHLETKGGEGAVREVVDLILQGRK